MSNHETILQYENNLVKRGTDQPVFNYIIQKYNIHCDYWPVNLISSHLHRKGLLSHNWQYGDDKTPFFIKYLYVWFFSGLPDRGDSRLKLMKDTWDLIKDKYK